MLDSRLRPLIDPPLNRLARALLRLGLGADLFTLLALGVGLLVVPALAHQAYGWALAAILINRLGDGLDGPLARASNRASDFGGYLDLVCDMLFYAAVPLGFALADPGRNALPAVVLLAGFMASSSSFLAFMALAEKRGLHSRAQGLKAVYYLAGLMEGAETILFFVLMCFLPSQFPILAFVFAALCTLTAAGRLAMARTMLR